MPEPVQIREAGSQLIVQFDDGSQSLAYPSSAGYWIVSARSETPDPDPGPDPGDGTFKWPYPLSSVTEEWQGYPGHNGMDFGQPSGTPLRNPGPAATVVHAGWARPGWDTPFGGLGWEIVLDHGTVKGRKVFTGYAHLLEGSISVSTGDTVGHNALMAQIGSSGNSTGPHLHYMTMLDTIGTIGNGAINPRVFMETYG